MGDLTRLPHKLDPKAGTCRVIIETPKGNRNKFDYDIKSGLFRFKSLLPEGMSFPLDFGFVPSTLCEDGDPLDIMVLVDEPNPVGALIDVRLIGVLEAEVTEDKDKVRNDRVIGVTALSHLYERVRAVSDLEPTFVDHLAQFWIQKDALEGRRFKVLGVGGTGRAVEIIKSATRAAKKSR